MQHCLLQVLMALPMVCLMFPLDAAASIMDGSLLAARQTNFMSYTQVRVARRRRKIGVVQELASCMSPTQEQILHLPCVSPWPCSKECNTNWVLYEQLSICCMNSCLVTHQAAPVVSSHHHHPLAHQEMCLHWGVTRQGSLCNAVAKCMVSIRYDLTGLGQES